jgi:predicted ATPase
MLSSRPELNAAISNDGLYLTSISGIPPFREVYHALTSMGFYNPNPDPIKDHQDPDTGNFLLRDGSNLASVLAAISPESLERVTDYLRKIVPGIQGVKPKTFGHKVTFEVLQEMAGVAHPWHFPAVTMSDGTLRALTILVALYQRSAEGTPMTLIGIEEPETALHPGAAAALSDALLEASHHVQILTTSHSPELLDNKDIPSEAILAVVAEKGKTQIGPVDAPTKRALADHLYTTGELLKMGQIQPDSAEIKRMEQTTLF